MPLARIITRHSEDALPLVKELHAQGYEVEVFAPDEPMEGEADVELVVQAATSADAAGLIQSRANEVADLFVAPGVIAPAIDEKAAAAAVAARAAAEAAQLAKAQREEQERVATEQRRVAEEAERARVAAEQRRLAEEAERERQRVAMERAELERRERETEGRRVAAAQAEAQRVREEQDRLTREENERRQREERARIAREAEEERQRVAAEAQRRAAADEEQRSAFRRVEEAALLRAQALEDERRRIEALHAGEERERQQLVAAEREREQAAAAQAPAKAETQQVEKEARPKRDRKVPTPVPIPTHAAAPLAEREDAYAAAMKYAATAEPSFRGIRVTRRHRYLVAGAGALVAAIVIALGWAAMSNRQPANPLGTGALMQQQNVDQQSPFGSTTVKPATGSQPTAAGNAQAAAKRPTSPSPKPSVAGQPKRPAKQTVRAKSKAADREVADDVVVRHYANGKPQPTKTTAQQKQPAGLKKISDMQ